MKQPIVFSEAAELARLSVQCRLLLPFEEPAFRALMPRFPAGRELNLLDAGCGSGGKTRRWFSPDSMGGIFRRVKTVVGLEYHSELVEAAQQEADSRFLFRCADVQSPELVSQLAEVMAEAGIGSFDAIYLSLILLHLASPETVLERLKPFLSPGGCLVIVEADDGGCRLEPDEEGLLGGFLDILGRDPYAGDRTLGDRLPALLDACGMKVAAEYRGIAAFPGSSPADCQRKEDIFTAFFSYLPDDIRRLREEEPGNPRWAADEAWLRAHYEALRRRVLASDSSVVMGVRLIVGAEASF